MLFKKILISFHCEIYVHTTIKRFVVSAIKSFFVSFNLVDTILMIKNRSFFVSVVPSRHPKSFFKNKKIRAQIGPCSPTPVEVDTVRRCCWISSGLHRAVGAPRPPHSWSSVASSVMRAAGAPRRLDHRVLLAAAEHHLCLA
jgi:hypothetical protein